MALVHVLLVCFGRMKSSGRNPVTSQIFITVSMRGNIFPNRAFVMHERSTPVRFEMSMSFRLISVIRFDSFVSVIFQRHYRLVQN